MKNHFSRRDTLRLIGGAGMLAALGGVGIRATAGVKINDASAPDCGRRTKLLCPRRHFAGE